MNSRREILVGIAGASALVAGDEKPAVHVHAEEAQSAAPIAAYVPKVFSPVELKTVGALCETIIPHTQTPGALDAKVHELIDEVLATRKTQVAIWKAGLAEVAAISRKTFAKEYADLSESEQTYVMTELAGKSKFFTVLKDATVENFYATKEGLMTELGWNAALPMPSFKGCTHPEHQV